MRGCLIWTSLRHGLTSIMRLGLFSFFRKNREKVGEKWEREDGRH